MAESAAEKTEEATYKKKTDSRKQGTVAKSMELTGALTLLALGAVAPGFCAGMGHTIWASMVRSWASPPTTLSAQSASGLLWSLSSPALFGVVPFLLVAMAVGVASQFAQVGFVLSAEPMHPNFNKINPMSGFKRVFSARGAVEALKAFAKLVLFAWLVYATLKGSWGLLLNLTALSPDQTAKVLGGIAHDLLMKIGGLWFVIAAADYTFQRINTAKQIRMTKQEVKQEMKEQETSPEMKMAIAKKRFRLARGAMAKKVMMADVIVTNPTHFAVALQYDRASMHAPLVLAKGQDYLALKIREIATDNDVPIVENKPLARALYAHCEPGDFVPRDYFGPVAEVLAYVYKTAKKTRKKAA